MENSQDDKKSRSSWLSTFLPRTNDSKATPGEPHERTSLLPQPSDDEPIFGSISEVEDGAQNRTQLIIREFWILLSGSVPVFLAYMLQNSLQTISVLVVGRLSPEALAVAAFSYMFAMVRNSEFRTKQHSDQYHRLQAGSSLWEEQPQSTHWLLQASLAVRISTILESFSREVSSSWVYYTSRSQSSGCAQNLYSEPSGRTNNYPTTAVDFSVCSFWAVLVTSTSSV